MSNKLIRISTDLEMTVHEFPEGTYSEQNKVLRELIGNHCDLYESVRPRRLYTEFKMPDGSGKQRDCVSMLVDEEGLLKENIILNAAASYLYETDQHGCPIAGNVLFVGECWREGGIDFCGIKEETFELLNKELSNLLFDLKKFLGRKS